MSNIRFISPEAEFTHLFLEKISEPGQAIWHGPHHLPPGLFYARVPIGPHRLWCELDVMDGESAPFGWSVYAMPGENDIHLLSPAEIAQIDKIYSVDETFEKVLRPLLKKLFYILKIDLDNIPKRLTLLRMFRWMQQEGISLDDHVGVHRIFKKVQALQEPIAKALHTQAGWDAGLENPIIDAE